MHVRAFLILLAASALLGACDPSRNPNPTPVPRVPKPAPAPNHEPASPVQPRTMVYTSVTSFALMSESRVWV
jgi:hypothetical protein